MDKHGSREYVQVLRLTETFDLLEVTPPHLPLAQVHATQAADYMTLLSPRQPILRKRPRRYSLLSHLTSVWELQMSSKCGHLGICDM
jgi:hypothetical protein